MGVVGKAKKAVSSGTQTGVMYPKSMGGYVIDLLEKLNEIKGVFGNIKDELNTGQRIIDQNEVRVKFENFTLYFFLYIQGFNPVKKTKHGSEIDKCHGHKVYRILIRAEGLLSTWRARHRILRIENRKNETKGAPEICIKLWFA